MKKEVPNSLKRWFLVHFIIDLLFAIPLIFAPVYFLQLFNFQITEPLMAQLVGSALLGIGGTSYFTKTKEQYEIMLNLKIIWSVSAILILIYNILTGAPNLTWLILLTFVIFSITWIYYRKNL
jgi:hypothetical protein